MPPVPASEISHQIASAASVSETGLTLVDYANAFESFALGVAALGAAYFGAKGIRSLLQEEDIKARFKIVRERNFELTAFALEILQEIDKVEIDSGKPLTKDKLNELRKLSYDLELKSHGSGSVPQTFCYLIRSILDELEPHYRSNKGGYNLSAGILESFFYNCVSNMIFYLDHNIEIPRKKRISVRNKLLSWWYGMPGKQELAAGSFGVFLSNRSHAVTSIHEILDSIHAETIYYILLFKYTRNTAAAVRKSLKFDVYIPPSLQVKETEDGSADIFLYGTRMYLIKTDIKTNIDSKEQSVMAYYHDLGRSNINLRDGDGLKTIIKNLKDEISEKRFFDMFETYTPLGDGSFRVEIPILKMGRKDKKFKRAVKKKLGPSALLNI
tara:strand:+ start:661 stop:1812 length:1152 start_codon:yes stop_codon:yes gene_type:complete